MREDARRIIHHPFGALALSGWFLAASAAAQETGTRGAEAAPGHRAVHKVRLLKDGGGRVDAAHQDDWIAFDMLGGDGFYDVYEMQISTGAERCITCEIYDLRKVNALAPAWHPSGEFLAVLAQSDAKKRKLTIAAQATPDRGLGTELWVVTRDGRNYWQVTRLGERGSAALDPHFSHEGGLLVWSERLRSRVSRWGEWGVRVAEFGVKHRGPRIGKVRLYRPGRSGLAIAHAFTPDDRGLLISASSSGFQSDLLRLDLETEKVEPITSAPDQTDGVVQSMPHADYLVWTTDRGLDSPLNLGRRPRLGQRSDVWLRSTSGITQERLTFFNHPRSDHHVGEALVDDMTWTADGENLLLHVVSAQDGTDEITEAIYLVEIGREYWRDRSGPG